ncbi:1-phosphofructokinase [Paenibacillus sp. sgz500958]|uniref:1-phosphofructokinase n=1 Tax=Paenibacillus sp. sgz500958 TaxID=3242475 RepID=UPI0036D3A165
MITTVTLNAAVDKTYYVDKMVAGKVHRVSRVISEPGGKGNNVAKVVKLLGGEVTASGFVAGSNGAFIDHRLQEYGILTSFVSAKGESRTCLNIIDVSSNSSTELLEQGPEIDPIHLDRFKKRLVELSLTSKYVVLSGSLPLGVPATTYSELIHIVQSTNARVYLDTSGPALGEGLQAKPHFVKPNEEELAQWSGKEKMSDEQIVDAAAKLAGKGIRQVCVTLGARGTIAFIDGIGYRAIPPYVEAVNTVGCGDSFVAGMVFAEEQGESAAQRLRVATAAACSNALSSKAGHFNNDVYQMYLHQVKIEVL